MERLMFRAVVQLKLLCNKTELKRNNKTNALKQKRSFPVEIFRLSYYYYYYYYFIIIIIIIYYY